MLSRPGASDPGRLRLRLELEKATPSPDGAATIAAALIPLKAEERSVGEGLADVGQVRIVIRRRGDVAAGDRFRLGERLFHIRSVFDPEEDGRYLVCLCSEEGSS